VVVLALLALTTATSAGGERASLDSGDGSGKASSSGLARVRFKVEKGASASVKVTPADGGSATATGSDGTTFELVVPPGAVLEDTTVRVVPLAGVKGAVGDGPIAVRFEPDGQTFTVPVKLTVRPGRAIGRADRFLFVADHQGRRVEPAFVDPRSGDATLYLLHFSIAGEVGVNDSLLDDALGVPAADTAADLSRQINIELQKLSRRGESEPSDVSDKVGALYEELDRTVFEPALKQMGNGPNRCSSVLTTAGAIETSLRERSVLSLPQSSINLETPLRAAYKDCEREAIRRCKKQRNPEPLVNFWLRDRRALSLVGIATPSIDGLAEQAKNICVPRRYEASGGGGGVSITGSVADITRPFVLTGSGDGFTIQLTYTPGDETGLSGTMTYEGGGGGVAMSGNSTYAIAGGEGGTLTLTQVGDGCTVSASSDCASGTEVVTLTPLKD
jgi:hypothetical protein